MIADLDRIDPYRQAVEYLDDNGYPASTRSGWRADPRGWAKNRAGIYLWSKQQEIIESVRDNPRVAVKSCHSTGKTFNAATLTCWWIDSHPLGSAFVLTTAPTGAQVKAQLWREINRIHKGADLPGRLNLTEWFLENEMVAIGRKPDDNNQSAFQGQHARYMLVILDEACGIPDSLWIAAESIASNEHSRVLAIGNPDLRDSQFFIACESDKWKVIHIGYWDTPNFTGEDVPSELKEMLVSQKWVQDRVDDWGEESALFYSKVRGEFPKVGADPWKVIPYDMAIKCRYLEFPELEDDVRQGGIDIGAGNDRTVIYERVGMKAGRVEEFVSSDPVETVGQLVVKINEWDLEKVKVDTIGVGWGIYGQLKDLSTKHNLTGETSHSAEVIGVNVAEQSSKPNRFRNKRAELWWNTGRENSRLGLWDLSSVSDDVIDELTTPKYEIMDAKGKIKIQPKEEVIDILNKSPDKAEALLLAFYDGLGSKPVNVEAVKTFTQNTLSSPRRYGVGAVAGLTNGRITRKRW
jgi:hypothetical protein